MLVEEKFAKAKIVNLLFFFWPLVEKYILFLIL